MIYLEVHENMKHLKGTKIHRTPLKIIVSCADMEEGDRCVSGQDLCFVFVSKFFIFVSPRLRAKLHVNQAHEIVNR